MRSRITLVCESGSSARERVICLARRGRRPARYRRLRLALIAARRGVSQPTRDVRQYLWGCSSQRRGGRRHSRLNTMLKGVAETHFEAWVAEHYEQLWPHLFAPEVVEPTLDCLHELAGGGACLEFGIGTGRIAIPLSRRGVRVHGIELSQA